MAEPGIGWAVVRELLLHGHVVTALARSKAAARNLQQAGAAVLEGDMAKPEMWISNLPSVEAVIQAAADFGADMGAAESNLLDHLVPALRSIPMRPRFVYTGGCWLYGETGGEAATEQIPFNPLPAFAWMVGNLQRILSAPEVEGLVVHPAMVYRPAGGVLTGMIDAAQTNDEVTIVGGESVHWPLVHAEDLAVLYRLAVEQGRPGESYNGAAVEGLAVGALARAIAKRHGTPTCRLRLVDADTAAREKGEWARGYGLDQRMSGKKARNELGWRPRHCDPLGEIAAA